MIREEIEKEIFSKLESIQESLRLSIESECKLLSNIQSVYYLMFLRHNFDE